MFHYPYFPIKALIIFPFAVFAPQLPDDDARRPRRPDVYRSTMTMTATGYSTLFSLGLNNIHLSFSPIEPATSVQSPVAVPPSAASSTPTPSSAAALHSPWAAAILSAQSSQSSSQQQRRPPLGRRRSSLTAAHSPLGSINVKSPSLAASNSFARSVKSTPARPRGSSVSIVVVNENVNLDEMEVEMGYVRAATKPINDAKNRRSEGDATMRGAAAAANATGWGYDRTSPSARASVAFGERDSVRYEIPLICWELESHVLCRARRGLVRKPAPAPPTMPLPAVPIPISEHSPVRPPSMDMDIMPSSSSSSSSCFGRVLAENDRVLNSQPHVQSTGGASARRLSLRVPLPQAQRSKERESQGQSTLLTPGFATKLARALSTPTSAVGSPIDPILAGAGSPSTICVPGAGSSYF